MIGTISDLFTFAVFFWQPVIQSGNSDSDDNRLLGHINHKILWKHLQTSQLVLAGGAMVHNGELFVLDMGQPVKILDLAEKMIQLSGVYGVEIIETGLRPGEKLYEELLVKTKELNKTDNELIYIERDKPLSEKEISKKLELLQNACDTENDDLVRGALRKVVLTFKNPEEVNRTASESDEMKNIRQIEGNRNILVNVGGY